MLVRAHDDAQCGAGVDVDVGIDAALADQTQAGQPLEKSGTDLGALPDQHERLGRGESFRQRVGVLDVVGEDGHLVPVELLERRQGPQGVEPVVEDGQPQGDLLSWVAPSG